MFSLSFRTLYKVALTCKRVFSIPLIFETIVMGPKLNTNINFEVNLISIPRVIK